MPRSSINRGDTKRNQTEITLMDSEPIFSYLLRRHSTARSIASRPCEGKAGKPRGGRT